MKKTNYKKIGEIVYQDKLSNGLEVFILPKKGFHKIFVNFATKYGSIDNKFSLTDKDNLINFPDGIAHFLEHKVLEGREEDVFQKFAKQGAVVNAYTNFTSTAYTLSTTTNLNKNLLELIDIVQDADFTDEKVNREKSIIEQEIKMYNDNPDWRARFGILENMYSNHPVKIDIAGTIPSINQITKEDLKFCYDTFYHPTNMALFIIGDVSPEEVINIIRNNQAPKKFSSPTKINRLIPDEKLKKVHRKSGVMLFPVQTPKVFIGYKDLTPTKQGHNLMKYELALNVLLELMFGSGSKTYQRLYEKGYIGQTFTYDSTNERSFGYSILSGDSQEPEKVIEAINDTILEYKQNSIKKNDVQRVIKKEIGNYLSAINSPQFIANQFLRYHFNKMNIFNVQPTLEALTEKDIEEVLHNQFSEDSISNLIIRKN